MLLVSFADTEGGARAGVWDRAHGEIVDLREASDGRIADMVGLIAAGEVGLREAARALAAGRLRYPVKAVKLLAPIPRPAGDVICVGNNYHAHLGETLDIKPVVTPPEALMVFGKSGTSVIGTQDVILASLDQTHSVDYEGELGVVIGREGRAIAASDAMKYVYGYTIVNDVTSRIVARRHQQLFLGKSFDTFCPMGPAILTADEVPDVTALRLQTLINDELRQDATVAQMIFDIPAIIATVSQAMTLTGGTVIATGTPGGVGMAARPPKFLTTGDVVKVVIEPIGVLENLVA